MIPANFTKLQDAIIRPGMEERLYPLMLYRGSFGLGRAHRLWNHAVNMMLSEAGSFSEGAKLSNNPTFAHLCMPRSPVGHASLRQFFARLRDNPNVADNMPGLADYVKDVIAREPWYRQPGVLDRLAREGYRTHVPWRICLPGEKPLTEEQKARAAARRRDREITREDDDGVIAVDGYWLPEQKPQKVAKVARESLFYPFLIHKPKNDDGSFDLLVAVNDAVPKSLPEHIRADVCQDLVVAVLAGEVERADLEDRSGEFMRRVFKMHPMKYGPMSLDAPFGEDNDLTLADVIPSEPYAHWADQMEEEVSDEV